LWPPGRGQFWPQGHNLNNFGSRPLDDAIYQTWKLWALLFPTRRFLKIAYFLTPWPTYAINQNHLNNFGRGLPRNHSSEVWSKSNERFQRRRCLSKKSYARRTPIALLIGIHKQQHNYTYKTYIWRVLFKKCQFLLVFLHIFRGRGGIIVVVFYIFHPISIMFCYLYSLDTGKHKLYSFCCCTYNN